MKEFEQAKEIIQTHITKLENRFETLSKRERVLILGSLLIAIYLIWNTLVFDIFLSDQRLIEQRIKDAQDKIASLKAQTTAISTSLTTDPLMPFVERINTLKRQNTELQEKMIEQTKKMVSPKEMAKIVKNLVEKTQALNITLLENAGAKPLFKINKDESGFFQVYQHGLKLEMKGTYFQTLQFLEAMEKQESKVLWSALTYTVEKYPKAKIEILIDTLGLEEAWIGV